MYVAIIGNKNSGKTIFVSLLYATQIKYTEETQGDFRFYSEPNTLAVLGYLYNSLRTGKWPKKKLASSVSFLFGYRIGSLGKRFKRFLNKNYEEPQISLEFGTFKINDKYKDQIENGTPRSLIMEPKRFESLVRSRIIITLLDSSNLGKNKKVDETISRIIQKVARSNNGIIYPIIVYTKFDLINNKKLDRLKLHKTPPDIMNDGAREEYGKILTKHYYPELSKVIINHEPQFYFVQLKVKRNSKGDLLPSLSTDPDQEIDYSYEEYNKIIEHLGIIGKIDMNLKH